LTSGTRERKPSAFQLQVNAWSEDPKEGMTLGPTGDIVFYPTLITLKAGVKTHKVRVGTTAPFGALERTYRPVRRGAPAGGKAGAIALRRARAHPDRVPIFVQLP